jgi:hypothetical protein
MKAVNRTISGVALVATFVFLPGDTWSFWMLKSREALYGEFAFKGETFNLTLAKNLLEEPVTIETQVVEQNWSFSVDGGPVLDLGNRPDVLPASYSLLKMNSAADDPDLILRSLEKGKYFRPVALTIVVSAEQDKWVVLVLCLMIATASLTWSVQKYVLASGLLEIDRGQD